MQQAANRRSPPPGSPDQVARPDSITRAVRSFSSARFSLMSSRISRRASSKVRPQPLQTASPWLVEQMAMQGVSGVVSYQAIHAARALVGSYGSSDEALLDALASDVARGRFR